MSEKALFKYVSSEIGDTYQSAQNNSAPIQTKELVERLTQLVGDVADQWYHIAYSHGYAQSQMMSTEDIKLLIKTKISS